MHPDTADDIVSHIVEKISSKIQSASFATHLFLNDDQPSVVLQITQQETGLCDVTLTVFDAIDIPSLVLYLAIGQGIRNVRSSYQPWHTYNQKNLIISGEAWLITCVYDPYYV